MALHGFHDPLHCCAQLYFVCLVCEQVDGHEATVLRRDVVLEDGLGASNQNFISLLVEKKNQVFVRIKDLEGTYKLQALSGLFEAIRNLRN